MTPYVVYISLQGIGCLERKHWLRNRSAVCVNVCSDIRDRERHKRRRRTVSTLKSVEREWWYSEQRRT